MLDKVFSNRQNHLRGECALNLGQRAAGLIDSWVEVKADVPRQRQPQSAALWVKLPLGNAKRTVGLEDSGRPKPFAPSHKIVPRLER